MIIQAHEHDQYCLFCGNKKRAGYDEYQRYYYCICEDYVFNKELEVKIINTTNELKSMFRKPKYEIKTKNHLQIIGSNK